MQALLEEEARNLQEYAQGYAAWTDRTGEARKGIKAGVRPRRNGYTLYLAHTTWYARLLETGAQPHDIEPEVKKALSWAGAKHPLAGKIRHPGIRPSPTLIPAVDANIDDITERILEYWSD